MDTISEELLASLYYSAREKSKSEWLLIARAALGPYQPMTPRSAAEEIDAVFRRNLDLLIQNLTVSDKNEITWMAISCRGVVQSLYPRKGS